jgi:serine/threonine protein phosphatase PrpC
MFFICSDGLGDWIAPDNIFKILKKHGIQDGTDILIRQAKEISFAAETVYDDITAVAIHCR